MHAPSSTYIPGGVWTRVGPEDTEAPVQHIPRDGNHEREKEERTPEVRTHRGKHYESAPVDRRGATIVDEKEMPAIENIEGINVSHYERDRRSLLAISRYAACHGRLVQLCECSSNRVFADDCTKRVLFASWFLDHMAEDADFHTKVLWSDECLVRLQGSWNTRNMVWWGVERPSDDELRLEMKTTDRSAVMVWAGVCARGLLGPFFIEGRITGKSYLKLVQEDVVPALAALGVEWFQQDGASPHYAKVVRRYLNKAMPGRWIGRGSPAQSWPARSPDAPRLLAVGPPQSSCL